MSHRPCSVHVGDAGVEAVSGRSGAVCVRGAFSLRHQPSFSPDSMESEVRRLLAVARSDIWKLYGKATGLIDLAAGALGDAAEVLGREVQAVQSVDRRGAREIGDQFEQVVGASADEGRRLLGRAAGHAVGRRWPRVNAQHHVDVNMKLVLHEEPHPTVPKLKRGVRERLRILGHGLEHEVRVLREARLESPSQSKTVLHDCRRHNILVLTQVGRRKAQGLAGRSHCPHHHLAVRPELGRCMLQSLAVGRNGAHDDSFIGLELLRAVAERIAVGHQCRLYESFVATQLESGLNKALAILCHRRHHHLLVPLQLLTRVPHAPRRTALGHSSKHHVTIVFELWLCPLNSKPVGRHGLDYHVAVALQLFGRELERMAVLANRSEHSFLVPLDLHAQGREWVAPLGGVLARPSLVHGADHVQVESSGASLARVDVGLP
mmetsp:Transcript_31583/g.73025  ORF Transcript_31583/g.73025 Transcript_31583/m.73025 type:complete len:434 (-) Transcript_31583:86-1387(-)